MLAEIRIGIDPSIELGPLMLAWHGVMTAAGLVAGGWFATHYARRRELDPGPVLNLVVATALTGIVGARLLFLLQEQPGDLLRPGDWLGTRGFSIYGGVIGGALGAAVYLTRASLDARYLDALAAGFPVGLAIGRIGDLISGEHYGPRTDLPWGVSYTHPAAEVPATGVAYHSGGLYEIVLGLATLAITALLWRRLTRPLALFWTVIGLYGVGRFVMFFYRSDSDVLALGLDESQWISVALVAAAGFGLLRDRAGRSTGQPSAASYSPRAQEAERPARLPR